jgi:hypothetical protein
VNCVTAAPAADADNPDVARRWSMADTEIRAAPLGWLAGGLLLGLVQTAAVALKAPLGVSTQFVVADVQWLQAKYPDYVESHPLVASRSYREIGYGFWLDVGIVLGAFAAAVAVRRWRFSTMPAWWRANQGPTVARRLVAAGTAGFLILFGARLAHGCTSSQFASGWAQLSLAAVPFTVALFGSAMLTARWFHPRTPPGSGGEA